MTYLQNLYIVIIYKGRQKQRELKTMFKELFKLIGLLSVVIIGGNLIALIQKVSSGMPDYMFLLTLVCMLIVLWVQVYKLIKSSY